MEVRKVEIDEIIIKTLEDLIRNFPIPTVRVFLEKYGTLKKMSMEFTNKY